MSGSDRGEHSKAGIIAAGIFAALATAAFIAWGLWQSAEYERQADSYSRHYAEYAGKQVRQACLSVAPTEKQKCAAEASDKHSEQRQNQRDLVAQRQSALWAYVMAVAAVIGMGLSAVGVILVWTTFRETKVANEIAGASARAWLSTEIEFLGNGTAYTTNDGREGYGYAINATIKNHGPSPATHVRLDATLHVMRINSALPEPFNTFCDDWRGRLSDPWSGERALFQGQDMPTSHGLFLAKEDVDAAVGDLSQKWVSLVVIGCVSYRTPHAKGVRQTRFMAHLTKLADGVPRVIDTAIPNWWSSGIAIYGPVTTKTD